MLCQCFPTIKLTDYLSKKKGREGEGEREGGGEGEGRKRDRKRRRGRGTDIYITHMYIHNIIM